MLSSTHSLVGAAAGKYVPGPILALFAGILAHFIFDKVPHFWPKQKKYENMMLFLDTVLTVSIVSFFIFFPGIPNRESIVAGAIGGALVDFFLVLMPEINETKLAKWHSGGQTHFRKAVFILNDVIIISAAIVILWL